MTDASTTSRPLFNRQQLISLFLPLVAEQALSISIGLADTLMVSSVGEAAVSGVSLVDSFNVLMIQLLSALATGGAVVASQYIGHREPKRAKASAAQIMFIMISLSVVTAVIVAVGRHAILRGIFGSIDADVMRYAETYFLLSALSYPFIGVYNAGAALFRAQGNSKISMLSSLVMNVVNIGGNAILIYRFGLGVMGAATASLVSRMIACFTVMFLLQKPDCALRIDHLTDLKPDLDLIKRILKVGIPAALQMAVTAFSNVFVQSYINSFGEDCMGGWTAYVKIDQFLFLPMQSISLAVTTFVGQNLGINQVARAKKGIRAGMLMAVACTALLMVPVLIFAPQLVEFFNKKREIVDYGSMLLRLISPFYVFCCINQIFAGALRGAGNSRTPMFIMIGSFVVFRQIYLFIMANYISNTIKPIALSYPAGWLLCSLITALYFKFAKWEKHRVVDIE